ncbi:MAG: hypothetical protein GXO91_07460 [FCB group bacterium]|nr:hypothetical protein [FCB group bacterium]
MNYSNNRIVKQIISGLLIVLGCSPVLGEMGGGYAGAPFRYGTNAREIALSNALVADWNPGFRQLSNPAAVTTTPGFEVGTSLFSLSLDRSIQVISVAKPLPPKGAAALSYFRSGTANITGRDLQGNITETLQVSDSYGMLSFGLIFTPSFRAGLNLKALFNNLNGDLSGKGIAFDLGFLYTPVRNLTFGGKLANLSGATTWNNDGRSVEEKLPVEYALGFRFAPRSDLHLLGQYQGLIAGGHAAEGEFRMGIESQLVEQVFFRGGLSAGSTASASGTKKFNLDYSLGFGIVYPLWKLKDLQFDYAVDPGNQGEGLSHLVSFSFVL